MPPFQVFATINRWHKERGFSCFGYHGLIMPDGFFYSGRPFTQIGAHCIEKNRGTLGILMIESYDTRPPKEVRPQDQVAWLAARDWRECFMPAQQEAVKRLLSGIDGIERVSGHNDHTQRICPGFKVQASDWL